jgi:hypothetical protein
MSIEKIIFLSYIPFTDKIKSDFYILELINKDIDVEYWDLADLLLKNNDQKNKVSKYITTIDNYHDLGLLISANSKINIYFISLMSQSLMTIRLYHLLAINNSIVVQINRGAIPYLNKSKGFFESAYDRILKLKDPMIVLDYMGKIFLILLVSTGYLKRFDLVFSAGSIAEARFKDIKKSIPINYFDYDNYLLLRESKKKIIRRKYCLFLDDNIVFDRDFIILKRKTVQSSTYYSEINKYFDLIEDKYCLNVVIASHPKSNYIKDLFCGREVYQNKTNELTKDCEFAIAHYSTSVAFPVLYKKPIIFIYTNEMVNKFYYKYILGFAEALQSKAKNISNIENSNLNIIPFNSEAYEKYKYNYLTSKETEAKISKDIFLDYVLDEKIA